MKMSDLVKENEMLRRALEEIAAPAMFFLSRRDAIRMRDTARATLRARQNLIEGVGETYADAYMREKARAESASALLSARIEECAVLKDQLAVKDVVLTKAVQEIERLKNLVGDPEGTAAHAEAFLARAERAEAGERAAHDAANTAIRQRDEARAAHAEARKALDALDRMNRGVDWCDQDEQARRWSAARRALERGTNHG